MEAKIKIRLYDDKDNFCGEYLKVEQILGWLRCQRRDKQGNKVYDLYSLNAELKIINGATKIYWASDGHIVAQYAEGVKNEIWQQRGKEELKAVAI